ncbi:MAG: lysophospholipid acyltransferase family protein [Pseudomonadota bacterium]
MSNASTNNKPPAASKRPQGPSTRRMDWRRRLTYQLGLPVVRLILWLLWRSYRFRYLPDQEALLTTPPATGVAPCYWHQQHVLCGYLIRRWLQRGFKGAFLISDSVDGEVPARLATSWGALAIRGSANRTGAAAMREMRELGRNGIGIVSTADGPLGPHKVFKTGVVLMAKLNGAAMLPISCAAERCWTLRRWDKFMIPKPFSRVVVAVGEPVEPARGIGETDLETGRDTMQDRLDSLEKQTKLLLAKQ